MNVSNALARPAELQEEVRLTGGFLLHIGTGKTGSTALQSALASQANALASSGVHYPVDSEVHHNALEALVLQPECWHRVHRVVYSGRETELQLRAARIACDACQAEASGKLSVLSSEYLYSLRRREIQRLLDRLRGTTSTVDAVMYVRQPSGYVLSGLQQFLKHEHDIQGLIRQIYSFADAIRNWSAILDSGRLHVRAFDRNALIGGDVVIDFATVLAARTGRSIKLDPPATAANSSMSSEECILLQELKRELGVTATPEHRDRNALINRAVRQAARRTRGLTPLRFVPGLADLIDANHDVQLGELRALTGIDFGIALAPSIGSGHRDELEKSAMQAEVARLLVHDASVLRLLRRNMHELPTAADLTHPIR